MSLDLARQWLPGDAEHLPKYHQSSNRVLIKLLIFYPDPLPASPLLSTHTLPWHGVMSESVSTLRSRREPLQSEPGAAISTSRARAWIP